MVNGEHEVVGTRCPPRKPTPRGCAGFAALGEGKEAQ